MSVLSRPCCSWLVTASCSHGNGVFDRHLPPSWEALGKGRSPWMGPVSIYFCIGSIPRYISFLRHRAVSLGGRFLRCPGHPWECCWVHHGTHAAGWSQPGLCGFLLWLGFLISLQQWSFRWVCNAVRVEESPVLG